MPKKTCEKRTMAYSFNGFMGQVSSRMVLQNRNWSIAVAGCQVIFIPPCRALLCLFFIYFCRVRHCQEWGHHFGWGIPWHFYCYNHLLQQEIRPCILLPNLAVEYGVYVCFFFRKKGENVHVSQQTISRMIAIFFNSFHGPCLLFVFTQAVLWLLFFQEYCRTPTSFPLSLMAYLWKLKEMDASYTAAAAPRFIIPPDYSTSSN